MDVRELTEKLPVNKILIGIGAFIVLATIYLLFFSTPQVQVSEVELLILSDNGNVIENTVLQIDVDGNRMNVSTNEFGKALFKVPANSKIVVGIIKEGFFDLLESMPVSSKKASYTLTLVELPREIKKHVLLQTETSEVLDGIETNLSFSCTNLGVKAPVETIIQNGKHTIVEPVNCGLLTATASANGFKTVHNVKLLEQSNVITLSKIPPKYGVLRVDVHDENKDSLTGLNVEIFTSEGVLVGKDTVYNGTIVFKHVIVGKVYAIISDPLNSYPTTQSDPIEIIENKTSFIDMKLKRETKAILSVIVKDSETSEGIDNVLVKLIDENERIYAQKRTIAGSLKMNLAFLRNYTMQISSEDYLSERTLINIKEGQNNYETTLEKLTPENSGRVNVRVVDEDNLAVTNAAIKVYEENTKLMYPLSKEYFTDDTGSALLAGLPKGDYYLRIIKERFESQSEVKNVKARELTSFNVKLEFGDAYFQLKAVDNSGIGIPQAIVTFFEESGSKLGSLELNANGEALYTTKANKRIYFKVSKEGYSNYFSPVYVLDPSKPIIVQAKLSRTIKGDSPKVEFLGFFPDIYSDNELNLIQVENSYVGKFKVIIPSNIEFNEVGMHLRTGNKTNLEDDTIFIREINSPISKQFKASSFNPPNGYSNDIESSSLGDSKWVNLTWENPEPGIYLVFAQITVKNTAIPGSMLSAHYRVWGEREGSFIRDPIDSELSFKESIQGKDGLYADTYDITYLEGGQINCPENFCYYGERILDFGSGILSHDSPFPVPIYTPQKLYFSILNNSPVIYSDGYINVRNVLEDYSKNNALRILSYKIINANSVEFESNEIGKEIEEIPIGSFSRNKTISGEITFEATKLEDTSLEVEIVSQNSKIYSKFIEINPRSYEDLIVQVNKEELVPYSDSKLTVTITNDEEVPVSNASVVAILKKFGIERILNSKITGYNGIVSFNIPKLSSDSKIIIRSEKPGYFAEDLVLNVGETLVRIDPTSLEGRVSKYGSQEKAIEVEIENLSNVDLIIEKAFVIADFKGYLNEEKTVNSINKVIGKKLTSKTLEDLELLTLHINPEKTVLQPKNSKGTVILVFTNKDEGISWIKSLPLDIEVGAGDGVSENGCIIMDFVKWKDTTLGENLVREFYLTNHCKTEAGPAELKNLKADITWGTNVIGDVLITIQESSSGLSFTNEMEIGEEAIFFEKMKTANQEKYVVRMEFIPPQDVHNKEADFTINFSAEIPTDTGLALVSSQQPLVAQLSGIDLYECITVLHEDEEKVLIGRNNSNSLFTIDLSSCGDNDLDVMFCNGGQDKCTTVSDPEAGIILDPWEIKDYSKKQHKVKVTRGRIPGYYEITLKAKKRTDNFYLPVKQIPVEITPGPDSQFYLDNYKFVLTDSEPVWYETLYNNQFEGTFAVSSNLCDMTQVLKNEKYPSSWNRYSWWGEAGGVMAGIGILGGPGALTFGPVGVVLLSVYVIMSALATPCEDRDKTHTFTDYIINLAGEDAGPSDARYVRLTEYAGLVKSNWVFGNWTRYFWKPVEWNDEEEYAEEVGIRLEKLDTIEEPFFFDVMQVSATKHLHGNELGPIYCEHSDFGNYNIKPNCSSVQDVEYSKKFHVYVRTTEIEKPIPPIAKDEYHCVNQNVIGRTGSFAKPKIKLNWGWKDFSYKSCDSDNPNGIYCDSTQFSIALSKRLQNLREFFEKNEHDFGCPEWIMESEGFESKNNMLKEENVLDGKIGFSKIENSFNTVRNDLETNVEIKNNSDSLSEVEAKIELINLINNQVIDSCVRKISVDFDSKQNFTCLFEELSEGKYYIKASGKSVPIPFNAWSDLLLVDVMDEPIKVEGDNCPIIKTVDDKYASIFSTPLFLYLKENPAVLWTDEIQNANDLAELLQFKARLIKDGYSQDFRKDFVEFYTIDNFADTPNYFLGSRNDPASWSQYFLDEEKMTFSRKYDEQLTSIPEGGIYNIKISLYFKENWEFFNDGEPNANIKVVFDFESEPKYPSPFYDMPFDGMVGAKGNTYDRQGYGTQFSNTGPEIKISNDPTGARTLEGKTSNSIMKIGATFEDNVIKLNNDQKLKGNLLTIESISNDEKYLIFSPIYATPVLMKIRHDMDSGKFYAFYSMVENNSPINAGDYLAVWQGAGACFDFTGIPVLQQFNHKRDRRAKVQDPLQNIGGIYGVEWNRAIYGGDVYLRTLFYTPANKSISLVSVYPTNEIEFISPDSRGQTVALNGISTMEFNRIGRSDIDKIDAVEDLFRLMDQNRVCVVSNGINARYWWNPKEIYAQTGTKSRSISEEMNVLASEDRCIKKI